MTNDGPRKSWRETIPGYLAGLAAVATATVSVLTFLYHRSGEPESAPQNGSVIERDINRPPVEAHRSGGVSTQARSVAAETPAANLTARTAAPSLIAASRPNRCAPYFGAWHLSTGELMTFSDDERVEIAASAEGVPRFGRWWCSGRDAEMLYVTPDRERTIVFTLAPDAKRLYQRSTKHGITPLEAVRESAP